MKYSIYIAVLVAIVVGCTPSEDKTVDLRDITPQSKRNYEKDTTTVDEGDSTTVILNRFKRFGIDIDELSYSEKKLFPDRVGPLRTEKYNMLGGEFDMEYYNWTYKDSAKVMNAFYNWLDMLGVEQVGSNQNIQKQYMCVLVGDTNLIYVNGSNGTRTRDWLIYHDSLGYDENWNYMIEQLPGRKAKWFRFEEGEKEEIKTEGK